MERFILHKLMFGYSSGEVFQASNPNSKNNSMKLSATKTNLLPPEKKKKKADAVVYHLYHKTLKFLNNENHFCAFVVNLHSCNNGRFCSPFLSHPGEHSQELQEEKQEHIC